MRAWQKWVGVVMWLGLAGAPGTAMAGGRLAWTGGVTGIEGAGGGALAHWALIGGLGTADEMGGSAFLTRLPTGRFVFEAAGVTVGVLDRIEFSYARQRFDVGRVLPGIVLGQQIVGLKLRVFGDVVGDQGSWRPVVSVGALAKETTQSAVPRALGAVHDRGVDVYLAATKVWLGALAGRNLLLDVTIDRSSANQFGLLGFGGPRQPDWTVASSVGVWVADEWLVGAELRSKHGALATPVESAAHDVFIAYGPSKHLTVVLGYADLGPVAGQGLERGPYLSLSAAF